MEKELFTKEQINQLEAFFRANNTNMNLRSGAAAALMSGGYDFADTLHNVYADYGYPAQLEFKHFWNMYRRFGVAKAVVDLKPEACWVTPPKIKSSSQFDKPLEFLIKKKKLWDRMLGVDKRNRVGQYAGLFMRVADGKRPDQPIEGILPGENALVQIIPLYESQLRIKDVEREPQSEKFGLPTMYQYMGSIEGDRDPNISDTFDIHPDRVVIISENSDDGSIYGVSSLEAPYNDLMDMRKISGGAAEGFYRNAAQNIVFESTEESAIVNDQDMLDKFDDEVAKFIREKYQKHLYTPGMTAKTLQSSMSDPNSPYMVALYSVAAATGIPATILIGQQTGRLASDEDQTHFNVMNQSRRENFLSSAVSDVLEWFISKGILPSAEYEIEWDDLTAIGDEDKLALSEKMASINEKQFRSGGEIPFSGDEIREAAGYEQTDLEMPDETLDDEEEQLDAKDS